MNRICKIIGAVAAAGVAIIAGTIFYRKGYGRDTTKHCVTAMRWEMISYEYSGNRRKAFGQP